MRLLIAASQFFGVVTLDPHRAHVRRIHQGRGVYTGISWSDEHVYVASLNNRGLWDDDRTGPDCLLMYDRYLRPRARIDLGARDIHQIHWHRDRLLVCDLGNDRLLSYPRGEAWTLPDEGLSVTRSNSDRHHLNTVWSDGEHVWVVVWYTRPDHAQAWRVDLEKQQIIERRTVGSEAHNLSVRGGVLTTCSSADEAVHILDERGLRASIGVNAYPRGLCHLGRTLVVGTGARGPREARHAGHAEILLLRRGVVWRRYTIPNAGQIYTLRALDAIDWAHQGDWGPPCPVSVLA